MKRSKRMMALMLAVSIVWVAAGAGSAAAQAGGCLTPSFAAARNFGAGVTPLSVTAGDFNADGRLDLATANAFSNNVSVLLNTCGAG